MRRCKHSARRGVHVSVAQRCSPSSITVRTGMHVSARNATPAAKCCKRRVQAAWRVAWQRPEPTRAVAVDVAVALALAVAVQAAAHSRDKTRNSRQRALDQRCIRGRRSSNNTRISSTCSRACSRRRWRWRTRRNTSRRSNQSGGERISSRHFSCRWPHICFRSRLRANLSKW